MRECATVPVREEDVTRVESTNTPVVEYKTKSTLITVSQKVARKTL